MMHPTMGRPRDPPADGRLLDATRTLLRDVGYQQLTMEAVALRAGVGKPTLYRRWHSKAELVFELIHAEPIPHSVPDTGSLQGDLTAMIVEVSAALAECDRFLFGEQLAAMTEDAAFSRSVAQRRLEPDLDLLYPIWERALQRGEADPGIDGREIIRDLGWVVMARTMLHHTPVDEGAARRLAERTVEAVRPRRRRRHAPAER